MGKTEDCASQRNGSLNNRIKAHFKRWPYKICACVHLCVYVWMGSGLNGKGSPLKPHSKHVTF